jgi:hypothetical protein
MADAGRVITVEPERLDGWLERFAGRHGAVTVEPGPREVAYAAADGALARVQVPFPPLAVDPAAADGGLVAHALATRRVGVVLVRLGGHAAGVFDGAELVAAKVGQRPVHGRSAAGGWSQQRFARRREGQARAALAAAADAAVATVLPAAGELDAVVLGGDRRAVEAVLEDPRLAPLRTLVVERRLDVPDPRRKVLAETPKLFRAVRIRLTEPPGSTP